jgi:adenylylsulfate kinase-like enzyme
VRRAGYLGRTLARHGVAVITAMISPYAATRAEVRAEAEAAGLPFIEVFLSAQLQTLIDRDVKGLYRRALAGEVEHFTGISDPYEPPANPEIMVHTDVESIDDGLAKVLVALRARGLIREAATPLPPAAVAAGRSLGW